MVNGAEPPCALLGADAESFSSRQRVALPPDAIVTGAMAEVKPERAPVVPTRPAVQALVPLTGVSVAVR